jgi:hypothetical protein
VQPRQLLGSDAEFLDDPRTGLLSGWGATHSTEKTAFAGLDVQSGADFDVEHYFGEPLRATVREGRVLPERIDDMVDWQLRSLFRLGVIDNPPTPGGVIDLAEGRRIAQRRDRPRRGPPHRPAGRGARPRPAQERGRYPARGTGPRPHPGHRPPRRRRRARRRGSSAVTPKGLRAAVARVLGLSRARVENERWTAFRSHYGIESMYCRPGLEGAHEKGGVEGQIGWFRRNHLVPVPEVDSLAELNAMVERWDAEDDDRRIRSRPWTIGEYFAVERPLLRPLPDEPFETGRLFSPRVDRYAQVSVRTNRYSVPVRLIGRTVRVMLHASEVVVYDGRREVARHERLIAKGQTRLELDHYLEALVRKPGVFPGATALEQARSAGKFTPVHDAWWAAACKAHGDRDGTRALIEVLLLGRHLHHEYLVTGLAAALRAGSLTADAVALEASKAAEADDAPPAATHPEPDRARVTFLTERRLAHLPHDNRPLPSVAAYDQLLRPWRSANRCERS